MRSHFHNLHLYFGFSATFLILKMWTERYSFVGELVIIEGSLNTHRSDHFVRDDACFFFLSPILLYNRKSNEDHPYSIFM